MKLILFILFSCILLAKQSFAVDTVRYPWSNSTHGPYEYYYLDLLALALDKSKDEYGDYQLTAESIDMNQKRALRLIKADRYIDVLWTMTSIAREKEFNPVRVPLLNGLGGCRAFLIRKERQDTFSHINSIEQLREMMAGQGDGWPDTDILRHNKFKVMTGANYVGLFEMLTKGRFDYFPRGIHEVSDANDYDNIIIEATILLDYPAPFYFFVSKSNKRLHKRLELGLIKAKKDGSFDALFSTHSATSNIPKYLNHDKRKVFHLENPYLSAESKAILENPLFRTQCK